MKDTSKLIKALEILARYVESNDGVANTVIAEAALTISELMAQVEALKDWRRLALKFDGHRMKAMSTLKMVATSNFDMEEVRRFIAAAPVSCEQHLREVQAEAIESLIIDAYDAGCLNDFGGGNVGWWQDYIRSELDAAHDFYKSQVEQYAESIRRGEVKV